jgi:membrane protein implicated in regulation of membrane protease activity
MPVVWLVLGVVLLLVESRHLAFYALFVAVGSLAAAVVALAVPSAIAVQVGVAVAVAVGGVVAVRPVISPANSAGMRRAGFTAGSSARKRSPLTTSGRHTAGATCE